MIIRAHVFKTKHFVRCRAAQDGKLGSSQMPWPSSCASAVCRIPIAAAWWNTSFHRKLRSSRQVCQPTEHTGGPGVFYEKTSTIPATRWLLIDAWQTYSACREEELRRIISCCCCWESISCCLPSVCAQNISMIFLYNHMTL